MLRAMESRNHPEAQSSLANMDIPPPPPRHKPLEVLTWDREPPYRTPMESMEELRSILIVDGNLTNFRQKLDELTSSPEEKFNIYDLAGTAVMYEAVRRDHLPFVNELLNWGIAISKGHV